MSHALILTTRTFSLHFRILQKPTNSVSIEQLSKLEHKVYFVYEINYTFV